jgi:hypothetical protein
MNSGTGYSLLVTDLMSFEGLGSPTTFAHLSYPRVTCEQAYSGGYIPRKPEPVQDKCNIGT